MIHRNLLIDYDHRIDSWYADCDCGWVSEPMFSKSRAAREFQLHVQEMSFESCIRMSLS